MTLNYRIMMIMETFLYLKEEVGGSIPGCEISSLQYVTENLPDGQLPHVLWRLPVGRLSQEKKKKRKIKKDWGFKAEWSLHILSAPCHMHPWLWWQALLFLLNPNVSHRMCQFKYRLHRLCSGSCHNFTSFHHRNTLNCWN